ncbi:hypothetical protein QBC43DRAFT_120721 [Cladorrhinum sp. PSN259]|nr:hypothetical protein QBC43DRAFT_120721 [Cladorrhinum sp. PSN259]
MSSPITKVALVGATGNLGPSILKSLLASNFSVTVLTRPQSTSTASIPKAVTIKEVDYDSIPSLTAALEGQQAVISTLGALALTKQLNLIEAAKSVGTVQKFIPSEFGSDTTNPTVAAFPAYASTKVVVQKALKDSGLNWSLIFNGPFLDWALKVGWVLDGENKKIVLYDGGEREFSATTLEDVGKAVVGVLNHPEETRNRSVYVNSAKVTLKGLLEKAKKVTGTKDEDWEVKEKKVDDLLSEAWAELKGENPNPRSWILKFITASVYGAENGGRFEKVDNELLGVKVLSDDEVEALVGSILV